MQYRDDTHQGLPCVKGAPAIAGEGLTTPPSFARSSQMPPPLTQGRLFAAVNAGAELSAPCYFYGLKPIPPSKVMVSPLIYLRSGEVSATTALPISFSESPK